MIPVAMATEYKPPENMGDCFPCRIQGSLL